MAALVWFLGNSVVHSSFWLIVTKHLLTPAGEYLPSHSYIGLLVVSLVIVLFYFILIKFYFSYFFSPFFFCRRRCSSESSVPLYVSHAPTSSFPMRGKGASLSICTIWTSDGRWILVKTGRNLRWRFPCHAQRCSHWCSKHNFIWRELVRRMG